MNIQRNFFIFSMFTVVMIAAEKINIPVVYCLDDGYLMPTLVSVESAINHMNKENTFYEFVFLVPGNFKKTNKKKLEMLGDIHRDNCTVKIIDMGNKYENYLNSKHRWPATTFYRYDIPEILLEKDKAIYLDGDTIIANDLTELYNIDLESNYLGGVTDVSSKQHLDILSEAGQIIKKECNGCICGNQYICSGVLLMNCRKMRNDNIVDKFRKKSNELSKSSNNKLFKYPDQHVINIVCYDKIKILRPKFMAYPEIFLEGDNMPEREPFCNFYSLDDWKDSKENYVIIHYFGNRKPWEKNYMEIQGLKEWYDVYHKIKKQYGLKDLFKKQKCECCNCYCCK